MKYKDWFKSRYAPTLDEICKSLRRWYSGKNGRFIRKEIGDARFRKRVKESLWYSRYADDDGRAHGTRIFRLTGNPIAQETEDAINALLGGKRIADEVLARLPEVKWAARKKRDIERGFRKESGLEDTSEIDTEERRGLHDKILNALHPQGVCLYRGKKWEPVNGRCLDIVLGLPASGKSTLIVADLAERNGARVCDADDIKEMLPEYNDGLGADLVRKEANQLNARAMLMAARYGENVVYPIVGTDTKVVADFMYMARKVGYKIHLTFAKSDIYIAKGRAIARLINAGRFTEPRFFAEAARESERTFRRLARYADSATIKCTYVKGAARTGRVPKRAP